MGWIDTSIVVVVVFAGVAIMYKALREPVDLMGSLILKGLRGIRDKLFGMGETQEVTMIEYG